VVGTYNNSSYNGGGTQKTESKQDISDKGGREKRKSSINSKSVVERADGFYRGGGGRGSHGGRFNSDDYHRNQFHSGGRGKGRRNIGGGRDSDRCHRGSFRHSDREDRGGIGRGGQQIIMGLDIQVLVDRLVRPGCDVFRELDNTRKDHMVVFQSGKALTAIISNLARRRNLRIANGVWDWIDHVRIAKNTFHYNSMISVCEKIRDHKKALRLLDEMKEKKIPKNEVTFSSAISACEKCGQWRSAIDLLDQMKKEGTGRTAIAYNAAISACEKGLVPHKALEIFEQMKREGVRPTVVTYSALISAAEKGQQWKLALEVLDEMKSNFGVNVIAYSAAISALSKGQMWHKALELFREIESSSGEKPSIVTYNATMTALEKGLQWERALNLFDEMKSKNMPVTVVSYGSAISACEKGLQYRQCLEYLDEMTEMGIRKNVIIFGAAMSCMEKSCRADIGFLLMDRMRSEHVAPNVHIYNSVISACARCNLWQKGYELFKEMEEVQVARDVVTYNAVLDAVCTEVELGRKLFKEGVEKGFYSRVSRLGKQWLELDLHFLSLGGGEIALGWWFEECLVPYLMNTSKLEAVHSISIVTGYGKTRARGARMNDDGMRLRVKAMLKYMDIHETPQPNKGRIHIDKSALIEVVKKNNGRIRFDQEGYKKFKEDETTANKFPDVVQQVRPRFRPARPGEGPSGTFIRDGDPHPPHNPSIETRRNDHKECLDHQDNRRFSSYRNARDNRMIDRVPNGRSSEGDRVNVRTQDNWRGVPRDNQRRFVQNGYQEYGSIRSYRGDGRTRQKEFVHDRGETRDHRQPEFDLRRGNRNVDGKISFGPDRDKDGRRSSTMDNRSGGRMIPNSQSYQNSHLSDRYHEERKRSNSSGWQNSSSDAYKKNETSDYGIDDRHVHDSSENFRTNHSNSEVLLSSNKVTEKAGSASKKRSYGDFQKQQPSRGYDIEPAYAKRRSSL